MCAFRVGRHEWRRRKASEERELGPGMGEKQSGNWVVNGCEMVARGGERWRIKVNRRKTAVLVVILRRPSTRSLQSRRKRAGMYKKYWTINYRTPRDVTYAIECGRSRGLGFNLPRRAVTWTFISCACLSSTRRLGSVLCGLSFSAFDRARRSRSLISRSSIWEMISGSSDISGMELYRAFSSGPCFVHVNPARWMRLSEWNLKKAQKLRDRFAHLRNVFDRCDIKIGNGSSQPMPT